MIQMVQLQMEALSDKVPFVVINMSPSLLLQIQLCTLYFDDLLPPPCHYLWYSHICHSNGGFENVLLDF